MSRDPLPPESAQADRQRHELGALLLSMVFAFLLMAGYSLLKPVRDEVGSAHHEQISWLWSGTFLVMLALVPLFGWAASRFPRRHLVPGVYHFFTLNLLVFYFLLRELPATGLARTSFDFTFYIWVSVFNLFALSLFWSFIADIFKSDQGKRLFGRVMMGATLGAIAGPALTTFLVTRIGTPQLLLVSMLLVQCAVLCFHRLNRSGLVRDSRQEATQALGGGIWDGARTIARSPYLKNICLYLLLFLVSGGFLYRLKAEYAYDLFEDRAQRTAFYAQIELISNIATLALQLFLTGKLLQKVGVGFTLAILPVLTMFAFGALGIWLSLTTIAIADVLRRAGNYALAKPAREVLFTVVPRDQKYKAKSFLDTFVYRGGDSAVSWMYDLFAVFLGGSGLAFAVVPFAALWTGSALRLGHRHKQLEGSPPPTQP
ncbi:MAG: NTP/NDP exchange transporter [Planctomycetota bacterium]|jgi:AAA family ATP:ADP antiporter